MAEQAKVTAPSTATLWLRSTAPSLTRRPARLALFAGLAIATVVLTAWLIRGPYRVYRLSGSVREHFAARRFEQARPVLSEWLTLRPLSAEAHYYRSWLALNDDRLPEAASALEEASRLGFDTARLSCLKGLIQARTGRLPEAEPALLRAYQQEIEPKADVARELARRYLTTFRLSQARAPIERWRTLSPEDPRPYMWLNEIESRSDGEPSLLIQNYRAALERDPNLESARLGLAEQLAEDSKLDEARKEYMDFLVRKPKDVTALVGLGRTKLALGDPAAASQQFEAALQVDPKQPEALRELARIDMARGRHAAACARLERLIEIEPHDHRVRYLFAQALKLTGDDSRSRSESSKANALRQENDHLADLRNVVINRPRDMEARFEIAKWMLDHGHETEGLDWTRQILQAEPGHVGTHRLLADYYEKRGNAGLSNYHRLQAGSGQGAAPK